MNIARFLSVGIIFVVVSCAIGIEQEMPIEDVVEKNDDILNPSPIVMGNNTYKPNNWYCAGELITTKDSAGNPIIIEIPLKCDPFADIYRGDPELNNNAYIPEEKINKKSPEDNSELN